jgi:hypothetical protein
VSVNRIIWSPDGTLFGKMPLVVLLSVHSRWQCSNVIFCSKGVAYSRHIVQIYSYHGGDDIRQHLEV